MAKFNTDINSSANVIKEISTKVVNADQQNNTAASNANNGINISSNGLNFIVYNADSENKPLILTSDSSSAPAAGYTLTITGEISEDIYYI